MRQPATLFHQYHRNGVRSFPQTLAEVDLLRSPARRGINRRDFLKLGVLSLGSLAFGQGFGREDAPLPDLMGRVTIEEIDVYTQPRSDTSLITGKRYRDQLVAIYYSLISPDGPAYNPVWYRVWGGYIHSGYVQMVEVRVNPIQEIIPEAGQLCEVTVPFAQSYRYNRNDGWQVHYRLYYETNHWVTGIDEGPDGKPWYQVTNELDRYLAYYTPAEYLRPIPDEEISPLSPEFPAEEKRIEVSLAEQQVRAFEGDQLVFNAKISSGISSSRPSTNGIPTETPKGRHNIVSKSPSKHMGYLQASGAPDGYVLPGVPWTSFFVFETGVAFHGTFWHNNFGIPMSRGCVNMRNADAKFLFRWTTPIFELPIRDRTAWDRRGYGTGVLVY